MKKFTHWLVVTGAVTSSLAGASTNNTMVGTLPGDVTVTESGAASYRIPIELPPGVNGMQPDLALVYNSQQRNGLLGIGWSLSGLSSITRCPTTLAQDGFIDGVDFDDNDKFCLSGDRLVAVNGNYGANGTEYRTENASYRKIVSYGSAGNGPAFFKVWYNDGRIAEFGNSDDSLVEAQGKADALNWAINKVEDRFGNTINYQYSENNATGEHYPASVSYAGTEVKFGFEGRHDVISGYISKSQYLTNKRLKNLTVGNSGKNSSYIVTYQNLGTPAKSSLASVQRCTDQCLPLTNLTWEQGYQSLTPLPATSTTLTDAHGWNSGQRYFVMDINGDGRQDIVARNAYGAFIPMVSNGTGFTSLPATNTTLTDAHGWNSGHRYFVMDINGDGMQDIVARSAYGAFIPMVSNGAGFTALPATNTTLIDAHGWNSGQRYFVLDINGDGRQDIVARNAYSAFIPMVSNGAGFTALPATSTTLTDAHGWNLGQRYFVMDINGDGRQDIVARNAYGAFIPMVSNGTGFTALPATSTTLTDAHGWNSGHRYFVMDINGDGRQDIVARNAYGAFIPMVSNGTGFTALPATSTTLTDAHGWNEGQRYFVMDINGDGMQDIVARNAYGAFIPMVSNGTGFTALPAANTTLTDAHGWNEGQRYFVMDINGDGMQDIVARNTYGSFIPLISGWKPSHITQITNGLGNVTKLTYKPLTDKSTFTKSSGSQYPVRDIQPTTYVVSKLEKANGVGGFSTTTYKYEGLKFHQKGLGSLGFAKMTSTQVDTGIKTINHYAQDVANRKIGLLTYSQTLSKNGVVLKDITQDWQVNKLNDGDIPRYQALLANSRTIQKSLQDELLSTITQQLTYDEFGNATEKHTTTVDKYGSYQQTVNTTYDNNESQWLFGLATRIEDTRSSDFSSSLTRTRVLSYDQNTGVVLQETVEPDNGDLFLKTQYEYDGYGNRVAITQSGSGIKTTTTRFNFTDNGRFLKSSVNALGFTTHQVIDPFFGVAVSTTDTNGKVTQFTYDSLGRALKERRADGTETIISRGWCNDACPTRAKYWVTTTASGNRLVNVYFDSLSRQVRTETQALTGQSVLTDTEYSALGVVKRQSQPYFSTDTQVYWTAYQYDELLRITQTTSPDDSVTKTVFDGLTQTATNEKDQVSTVNKNALGQVVSVVDALGNNVQYQYDAFGGLTKTIDPAGNITTIEYDFRGRKVAMSDPDKGRWTYGYDALDRLTQQQNAKGQITKIEYDLLGRKIKRIDNAQLDKDQQQVSQWIFDRSYKGVLDQVISPNYSKQFGYDQYQRAVSTTQTAFGESFTIATEYDNYSRPLATTYPTGLTTKNVYNERGYLVAITDGKEKSPNNYWQAKAVNPQGNVIESVLGNGVETLRYADPQTGRITDIAANLGSVNQIELLHFSYDKLGNLLSREDVRQGVTENFSYDQLNRLTESTAVLKDGFKSTQHVSYDELGNITFKSDVGNYSYGGNCDNGVNAGPHAVTQTTGIQNTRYCYDLNGNMVSGNGRTITYTAFDKPSLITKGNLSTAIDYGANRSRIRRVDTINGGNTTTFYMGGIYEKVVTNNNKVEHKHYIGNFAIVTQTEGKTKTNYLHKDHLGSVVAITDDRANVVERFSYDPWGKKRFTNWKPGANYTALASTVTTRGFTGHENLDAVGLIHMNGRVYDQNLGRFLSADPFIQNPYNSQSLNRYTYVFNNPLNRTDPTGYLSFKKIRKKVRKLHRKSHFARPEFTLERNTFKWTQKKVHNETMRFRGRHWLSRKVDAEFVRNKTLRIAGQVIVSYYFPGIGTAAYSAYLTSIMGGDYRAAYKAFATSYASSTAFRAIDASKYFGVNPTNNAPTLPNVAAHTIAGGVISKAQGGSFTKGALFAGGAAGLNYTFHQITVLGEKAGLVGQPQGGTALGNQRFATRPPRINSVDGFGNQSTMKYLLGFELMNYTDAAFGFADAVRTNGAIVAGSELWFNNLGIPYNVPFAHEISLIHDIGLGFFGHGQFANISTMPIAAGVVIGGYAKGATAVQLSRM